jgi:hypothetical protein
MSLSALFEKRGPDILYNNNNYDSLQEPFFSIGKNLSLFPASNHKKSKLSRRALRRKTKSLAVFTLLLPLETLDKLGFKKSCFLR